MEVLVLTLISSFPSASHLFQDFDLKHDSTFHVEVLMLQLCDFWSLAELVNNSHTNGIPQTDLDLKAHLMFAFSFGFVQTQTKASHNNNQKGSHTWHYKMPVSISVRKCVFSLSYLQWRDSRTPWCFQTRTTDKNFSSISLYYVSVCCDDFSSCLHIIPNFVSIYWK